MRDHRLDPAGADYGPPQLGVVVGDRALHYAWDGARSFHRLDVDPAELADVYTSDDPDVVALWEEMESFVQEVQRTWPHLADPVDARP